MSSSPATSYSFPPIQTTEYSRSTELRHPFKLNGSPLQLRVQLQRGFNKSIASNACPTWVDGVFYNLTSDEQGLTQQAIKKTSVQGKMVIKNFVPGIRNEKHSDRTIKLNIGFLDPA